jgi:acyl carrier protein
LDTTSELTQLLLHVLGIGAGARSFNADTPLLGAVPELDSMAVASLLGALEERFGFSIADDEIDGSTFATFGSLVAFVDAKRA